MIDLLSIWLIVWLLKNAAVDVSCALKGTENPRYALKRQKALAAGKTAPKQSRYGSRDWLGDLVSDGLAAQTERRRAKADEKAKAAAEAKTKDERPLDDLAEAVREEPRTPVAAATVRTEEFPNFVAGEDYCKTHQMPRLKQGVWGSRGVKYCPCGPKVTFIPPDGDDDHAHQLDPDRLEPNFTRSSVPADVLATARAALAELDPEGHRRLAVMDRVAARVEKAHPSVDPAVIDEAIAAADRNVTPTPDPYAGVRGSTDTRPDAVIYQFPNPKKIEKEIRMATSEVTGLSTALAFAQTAADAHASFATGGTEGYTGALAQHGVGDGCISSAKEAQEASSIAAAKWAKHHDDLTAQLNVKEAYQGSPDAGNKQFLLNG